MFDKKDPPPHEKAKAEEKTHAPADKPAEKPKLDRSLVGPAIDPEQDRDENVKKTARAAQKTIGQFAAEHPDVFQFECAQMDDEDARAGARERRSQALRGRLIQAAEEEKAEAEAAAAKKAEAETKALPKAG